MTNKSLQETYAPKSICFGCGPANDNGLHVQSFVDGERVIAEWTPSTHHQAFPGVLNGGIIGSLLDCHCNWAAAWHLMQTQQGEALPSTVTAEYKIKLLRPTPTNEPLRLEAEVLSISYPKAIISGKLLANGKVCATCEGKFVAVSEGHPAFHRW